MIEKKIKSKRKKESNIRVVGYNKDGQPIQQQDWDKASEKFTLVVAQWYKEGKIGV